VNRIVLERKPWRPQLPPYDQIDQDEIREAAAAWDAAKASLESARRDVVELEGTREAAEWLDAEAAEKARAEGKPEPKRSHVAEHDKKLDQAQHEHRVAQLTEERTFNELQAALDEHQGEWAESIERAVKALDEQWAATVNQLTTLHAQRASVFTVRRLVVGGQRDVGIVGFTPSQIHDIEFAPFTHKQIGHVAVGDVLAGLADLGFEPAVETPVERPRPKSGHDPFEDEAADRRREAKLVDAR
jgi:hypothetical protein